MAIVIKIIIKLFNTDSSLYVHSEIKKLKNCMIKKLIIIIFNNFKISVKCSKKKST